MAFRLVLVLVCWVLSSAGYAADTVDDHFSINCNALEGAQTTHFKVLNEEAVKVDRALCLSLVTTDAQSDAIAQEKLLQTFAGLAETTAKTIGASVTLQDLSAPFADWRRKLGAGGIYSRQLPSLSLDLAPHAPAYILYFGDPVRHASFQIADDQACNAVYGTTCHKVLDEYRSVVNVYKTAYTTYTANAVVTQTRALSAAWDDYLQVARSQTTLDLLFTTWVEHRHFSQGRLVGPPGRQWSLLHPDLVYEHLNGAGAGSADQMGIAIEWVGVNWWNKDASPLHIPFGVSVASVYDDRPGITSVGHGLMFHFYNKYSIGWARRDGKNGYYVSIDLLNAVENKKAALEKYKALME